MDTLLLVLLVFLVVYVGFKLLKALMGLALKLVLLVVLFGGAWLVYHLYLR